MTPDRPVFTGETVNLKCVIESHSDWRYEWYKDSVMLHSSDRYTVNRDTLTIRGATESDQGQYWCRGQRDRRPQSSQSSFAFSLTVIGKMNIIVLLNSVSNSFSGKIVYIHINVNAYMLTSLTMHFSSQLDRLCLVTECMAEKMVVLIFQMFSKLG